MNAKPSRHLAAFASHSNATSLGSPLRILHVFRAPVGGLFRHVVDVARAQIARGLDVGIFCDSSTGGERAAQALDELRPGLTLGVTRVPMWRNPHPLDAAALYAFNRAYRSLKPNVLHGHGSKGGAYARLALSPGLDRGTIRAYTPHGGSFNYKPGTVMHRLYMTAEALLAKRTDVFLFESGYIGARFRDSVGETDRTVRIVLNGISEAEFEPIAHVPDPFDLVYVGELRQAKGIDTLIDAVALLRRERRLRLTLLIVGSGPDDRALQTRAKEAGIGGAPQRVRALPLLAQADGRRRPCRLRGCLRGARGRGRASRGGALNLPQTPIPKLPPGRAAARPADRSAGPAGWVQAYERLRYSRFHPGGLGRRHGWRAGTRPAPQASYADG